jgi:hypothetical protein
MDETIIHAGRRDHFLVSCHWSASPMIRFFCQPTWSEDDILPFLLRSLDVVWLQVKNGSVDHPGPGQLLLVALLLPLLLPVLGDRTALLGRSPTKSVYTQKYVVLFDWQLWQLILFHFLKVEKIVGWFFSWVYTHFGALILWIFAVFLLLFATVPESSINLCVMVYF